jgi:hypothetical protein
MPSVSTRLAPRKSVSKAQARSRITNGADILPGVDGRSLVARRYRDIVAAIAVDQGGADRMSEARAQLVRRFAALAVQAEMLEARLARGEAVSIADQTQIASTLVRLAARIGIGRTSKIVPDLHDYLEGRATIDAEDVS